MANFSGLLHDGLSSFDNLQHGRWLHQNWWVSIVISAVYLMGVFGGKQLMADRPAFDLRRLLAAWSSGLAIFSLVGSAITWSEFAAIVRDRGWHASVCAASFYDGEVGTWVWLFALSKVVELGDTAFIVLRKQKLIFLHWYHHVTTLISTWFFYTRYLALGRYFVTLNFGVHSFMYAYYALSAARILNKPRVVKVAITVSQLAQFVVSLVATFYANAQLLEGNFCDVDRTCIAVTYLLYGSFLFYFWRFFYDSYVQSPRNTNERSKVE